MKTAVLLTLTTSIALPACSGSRAPATPAETAEQRASACHEAGKRYVEVATRGLDDQVNDRIEQIGDRSLRLEVRDAYAEYKEGFAQIVAEGCVASEWNPSARRCMARAESESLAQSCLDALPDGKKDALEARVAAEMPALGKKLGKRLERTIERAQMTYGALPADSPELAARVTGG